MERGYSGDENRMFQEINEELSPAFDQFLRSSDYRKVETALARFKQGLGASRIRIAPHPLIHDAAEYLTLVKAARAILSAQQKIVQALLEHRSRTDLLVEMGIDPVLVPLVDWDQLVSCRHRVVRLDVLPTMVGPVICEMNFAAAVGGAELYGYYQAFAENMHAWPSHEQPAPLDNLAHMYERSCRALGIDRLQLLDWSSHASLGYPTSSITAEHFRRMLPDVRIETHDETSWARQASSGERVDRTLIHRLFTYDDVTENTDLYREMLERGARFSNGLEAELLMSKGWLSLLWQQRYWNLLEPGEISAIQSHLIPTFDLTDVDLSETLDRKDGLLFKRKNGYGGLEVIPGRTVDADVLSRTLRSAGITTWVYQPLLDVPLLRHLAADASGPAPHRLVLGLYLHEGRDSGMLTRSARDCLVVNAGNGACAGWASIMDSEKRNRLLDKLENYRKSSI